MRYVFLFPCSSVKELSAWVDTLEDSRWIYNDFFLLYPSKGMDSIVLDLQRELLIYKSEAYPPEFESQDKTMEKRLLEKVWETSQRRIEIVLVVLLKKHPSATWLARALLEKKFQLEVPPFLVAKPGEAYLLDLGVRSLPKAM